MSRAFPPLFWIFLLIALQELIADRFPLPRFIVCDAGGSQARFLLSKLNPSTTHTTGGYGGGVSAQTIFTDDVSLQTFMDHLMKWVLSFPIKQTPFTNCF